MVFSYYFLHILTGASLIAAQSNTYTALPAEAYKVTTQDIPAPEPDEIVVRREENGDINLFIGSERRDQIKQARDGCGGNLDLNCYNSVAKAWGYGQDGYEKGISKRFAGLLAAAFVLAGIQVFIGIIYELTDDSVRLPAEEQEKAKHAFGESEVYQSADGAIKIEVPAGPVFSPPEESVPTVTFNADGSADITMAEEDVSQAKQAIEHIVCKRSMRFLRRQAANDALRECIELASQDIAKNTDIGAWLQKFQGLRWVVNMPGAPDEVPLPAQFPNVPQALEETADLLSIFGEGAERVRTGIARFSLLLGWAQMGAGVEISAKMHIPVEKMKQKDSDEDPASCKAPSKDGNYFCDEECGGKNAAPGRAPPSVKPRQEITDPTQPLDEYSQIWSCKGRNENDERKGCDCVIRHRNEPHIYPGLSIQKSQALFKGPPCSADVCGKSGTSSPPASTSKTCYKQDAERMKDRSKWRFVGQVQLDEYIKDFCGPSWISAPDGEVMREYPQSSSDAWNQVAISVGPHGKQENCERALMDISAGCDWSSQPDTNNMNQFNFKWGGEFVDEEGARWTIEPLRERVALEAPSLDVTVDIIPSKHRCNRLGGFGFEFGDEPKMALQMCIHALREKGEETEFNCGGLMTVGLHLTSYKDAVACVDNTWECLSYQVEHNEASQGFYRPGTDECDAKLT